MTSATLTTAAQFTYVRDRLGLSPSHLAAMDDPPPVHELVVPSHFDYAGQTLIGLPTDLAGARSTSRRFSADTAMVVAQLAEITGGGLLVLHTAYSSLREVAGMLRAMPGWDRPLFVQGESSRTRLLDGFTRDGDGILLGTASFWEGVDVPGSALRALVLQKLPFRPPHEPVTEARLRAIEDAGRDSFRELSLPQAALRLKQGFGRLVRRTTDRGAVLVLDDRIVRMRYGRYFLDSLPSAPRVRGPWLKVRGALEDFYGRA